MAPPAPTTLANVHGRKPTRGLRPWLLIPKVVAVGFVLGLSIVELLLTNWARQSADFGDADYAAHDLFLVKHFLTHFLEPAVGLAALLGLLLFLQHPAVFLRQRWWQGKMVLLAATGAASLWLAGRLELLGPGSLSSLWRQVAWGQWGLIGLTISVIVLGRLKPRLGSNPARAGAGAATSPKQGTTP
jgi:hypothetical protein